MSAEARATTIRSRLRRDLVKRIGMDLFAVEPHTATQIIDDAVDEAMFPIEHLLVEIEGLEGEKATLHEQVEALHWKTAHGNR